MPKLYTLISRQQAIQHYFTDKKSTADSQSLANNLKFLNLAGPVFFCLKKYAESKFWEGTP